MDQVGPKDSDSQNFSFLASKEKIVGVYKFCVRQRCVTYGKKLFIKSPKQFKSAILSTLNEYFPHSICVK
jgi:hypothetical protein